MRTLSSLSLVAFFALLMVIYCIPASIAGWNVTVASLSLLILGSFLFVIIKGKKRISTPRDRVLA